MRFLLAFLLALLLLVQPQTASAAPPQFAPVTPLTPDSALTFPRDFGEPG